MHRQKLSLEIEHCKACRSFQDSTTHMSGLLPKIHYSRSIEFFNDKKKFAKKMELEKSQTTKTNSKRNGKKKLSKIRSKLLFGC